MRQPWICPACGRGVAADQTTCNHGAGMGLVLPVWPPADFGKTWWKNGQMLIWKYVEIADGAHLPGTELWSDGKRRIKFVDTV